MEIVYKTGDGRYRIECPVVVNRRDGSVLVRVPAGAFEMGDGENKNCPKHRVELSEYWIGVYAVTNRQWRRFVKETKREDKEDTKDREDKFNHPKVHVTWDDARAYCQWAGGDLPTEAQWEKAARGPAGLIYPWGNRWDDWKCRNNWRENWRCDPCEVWKYADGASGYGTYQQSGNVWEWCRDWYDSKYYSETAGKDPTGPESSSQGYRVSRGCSSNIESPDMFRGAYRGVCVPHRGIGQGFRLVRTASSFAKAAEDK